MTTPGMDDKGYYKWKTRTEIRRKNAIRHSAFMRELAAAIRESTLSYKEMAMRAGITTPTVSKLACGETTFIRSTTLIALQRVVEWKGSLK